MQIVVFKPYSLPWNQQMPASHGPSAVYWALPGDAKLSDGSGSIASGRKNLRVAGTRSLE